MKLSVSVPDELWKSARDARPEMSPSRLVQSSLESLVASSGAFGFAFEKPARATESFEKARHKLEKEARAQFELGYLASLEVFQLLGRSPLEQLAIGVKWDIAKWARSYADASVMVDLGQLPEEFRPDKNVIQALGNALGEYMSPYFEETFTPDTAYLRGFARAARDLWASVFEGGSAEENSAPVGTH